LPALLCLPCFACLALPALLCLPCFACLALPALLCLPCFACPALPALLCLPCFACPALIDALYLLRFLLSLGLSGSHAAYVPSAPRFFPGSAGNPLKSGSSQRERFQVFYGKNDLFRVRMYCLRIHFSSLSAKTLRRKELKI
jgi:hypothetical protein